MVKESLDVILVNQQYEHTKYTSKLKYNFERNVDRTILLGNLRAFSDPNSFKIDFKTLS